LIASHGHTVKHLPQEGITLQIGKGQYIASKTGRDVVFDFRSLDVSLGGQGAPLVPIGDIHLFFEHKACLNLGGYSNVSFEGKQGRQAFDICPVNTVLNMFAACAGKDMDVDGEIGQRGRTIPELLKKLNAIPYYSLDGPRSLGEEWLKDEFLPLLPKGDDHSLEDVMRTVYEHIAFQISGVLNKNAKNGSVLITGGGTYNIFLLDLLRKKCTADLQVPDKYLIDFKEAIIFGFLGLLRTMGINNCLASVTGASADSCGGQWIRQATGH